MDKNGSKITPAVVIIFIMILINAAMFFYFDDKYTDADKKLADAVAQVQEVAKRNTMINAAQEAERKIRTDQNCELFERDHKADVEDLRDTYKFLSDEQAALENPGLTRFVILNLPRSEAEARIDNAPEYCDDPGVGLKEPDPVIPERPKNLDDLTRKITPQS